MSHYQDVFWSNDHLTGIRSLLQTLETGQTQTQVSLQYFQTYTETLDLQSSKLNEISNAQERYIDSRSPSHSHSPLGDRHKQFLKKHHEDPTNLESLDSLIEKQSLLTKGQSLNQQTLVSKVESNVIIPLRDFLADYQDFQSEVMRELNASFKKYRKSIQQTNSLRSKFEAKARLVEDSTTTTIAHEVPGSGAPVSEQKNKEIEIAREPPITRPVKEEEDTYDVESEDASFKFPLKIGDVSIETVEILSNLLSAMIDEVPISRRMIPIPGINNEYFKSTDLAHWVKLNFPKEDTTNRIEKFGKDLIALGLVSNWNKLSQNMFVSDPGFYYEFTDLARFTSRFDQVKEETVQKTVQTQVPTQVQTHPVAQPQVKSNVWSGLRNKLSGAKDISVFKEQVTQIRSQYFTSMNESIDLKFKLESKITSFSKKAEVFQRNRIQLIHKLNVIFNERVIEYQKSYLSQLESIQQDITTYGAKNVELEILKSITASQSGWYWPVSETKFIDYSNRSTTVEIFDTDIVNLDTNDTEGSDFRTKSIPLFISQIITRLDDEKDIGEYWTNPIDPHSAQRIKKQILTQIFQLVNSPESPQVKIKSIVDYLFKKFDTAEIISFFKFWLLELPDSLLPFTVYDSLVHAYDTEEPTEVKLHTFGSIPRQNLATLLLLITHLQTHMEHPAQDLLATPGIPFIHLLIRPSATKTAHFNILDSLTLESLLVDLFNKPLQDALYAKLESLEQYHMAKLQRAQDSMKAYKSHKRIESELTSLAPKPVAAAAASDHHQQQQQQQHLTVDGLKPFRTVTPSGTPPVTSPRASRSNSASHNGVKTNLLSPSSGLKRPSDSLNKRKSRNLETAVVAPEAEADAEKEKESATEPEPEPETEKEVKDGE